jgi:mono/diheme cytochrome c family protein
MRALMIGIAGILSCVCSQPPAASAGEGLALRTRAIFAARCASCHGPDLAKPEGRFGYVLDLRRVAANRELVVPRFPDESELWELVRRGEMPPADSEDGPLTEPEKNSIRDWIAAGAPGIEGRVSGTSKRIECGQHVSPATRSEK